MSRAIFWPARRSSRSPSIATRLPASEFPPQMIDDTLNDAYGQRQITQYFTQLNTYFLILEILPDLQTSLESLDRIYVKSPLTGAAVPLSALVDTDSYSTGPLSVNHQGQFPCCDLDLQPAGRRCARRGGRCHQQGGARHRHAQFGARQLPGQRPGIPVVTVERAGADRGRARGRLHHPRDAL